MQGARAADDGVGAGGRLDVDALSFHGFRDRLGHIKFSTQFGENAHSGKEKQEFRCRESRPESGAKPVI